ncbi:MAG: hypothetical protein U1E39_17335 [Planctomycetota bacterium]
MQSILIIPRTSSTRSPRPARGFRSAAPADAMSLGVLRFFGVFAIGAITGGVVANFGAPADVAVQSMAAVCVGAALFASRHVLAAAPHGIRRDVRRVVVRYLRWARSHRGDGFR